MPTRICVAQIGAAHGIRGEVKLHSFTADPAAVADYGVLESEDGTLHFEIEALRHAKGHMVAQLSGVRDRAAEKPIIAKSLAEKNKAATRPDWDAVKDEVMYRAVRRKFELHAELRALLLATGEEDIAESAPSDYYWGVGREGTGQNRLGKMMERIRAELRGEAGR